MSSSLPLSPSIAQGNNRIQFVNVTAGIVTTIAGNAAGTSGSSGNGGQATSAYLNGPCDVAFDSVGNLAIADQSNHRIQYVNVSTGVVTTIAGISGSPGLTGNGGLATSALLNSPSSITFDALGNLAIADTVNNRIQYVSRSSRIVTTIAGSAPGASGFSGNGGPATSALLNAPGAIRYDKFGNLVISDTGNSRIQYVTSSSIITTIAGDATGFPGVTDGLGGPATSAHLFFVNGVAVDSSGNIAISDTGNSAVKYLVIGAAALAGDVFLMAGIPGVSGTSGNGGQALNAMLNNPMTATYDSRGNLVFVDVVRCERQRMRVGLPRCCARS